MAYAMLLEQDILNNPCVESFRYIRDVLSSRNGIADFSPGGPNPGPGYEIVDEYYASSDADAPGDGDWCVLRSFGEAGTYPHYLTLICYTYPEHSMTTSLYWNVDTHKQYISACLTTNRKNIFHGGISGKIRLSIYADLDECHILTNGRNGFLWDWSVFGRISPDNLMYDGTAVQVVAKINGRLQLPSWPSWAAEGKRVFIWGYDNTNGEAFILQALITDADEATRTIVMGTLNGATIGDVSYWITEDLCIFSTHEPYNPINFYYSSDNIVYQSYAALPYCSGPIQPYTRTRAVQAVAAELAYLTYLIGVFNYKQTYDHKYIQQFHTDLILIGYSNINAVYGRLKIPKILSFYNRENNALYNEYTDGNGNIWRSYRITQGLDRAFPLKVAS